MQLTQLTGWLWLYGFAPHHNSDVSGNRCGLDRPFNRVAGYLPCRQHLDELILSNDPVRGTVHDVVRVHERLLGMSIAGEDDAQLLSVSSAQAGLIGFVYRRFNCGPSKRCRRQERHKANERNEKILAMECHRY